MFQGYTQGAVDFLWNLQFNNERSWFQAHKEEFLELVDRPTRELAARLEEEMRSAYPKLGLESKVSRRDNGEYTTFSPPWLAIARGVLLAAKMFRVAFCLSVRPLFSPRMA